MISIGMAILLLAAWPAPAQESATQQQIDRLSGQIQDLLEAQAQQNKRLDALERELADVRDKVNTPVVNDYASRDDVKKLADQLQEIDRKRKEDSEMVAKQIEGLAKTVTATPPPPVHTPRTTTRESDTPSTDTPAVPTKGYEYVVQPGDTLGLIVKAYRDKGVKVTKTQIKAANPKMNPDVLIPGRKIFIPDASAK